MITIDFTRLNLQPGDRVLDIGCGEGRHTAKVWEFPGIFCVGADMCYRDLLISQKKLRLHEELSTIAAEDSDRTPKQSSVWTLLAADITKLPFEDQSFDTIICSEVMEHIHDEKRALAELTRILKPGGSLALSVPRYWPEKICWKLSDDYCHSPGGHIRIYRKKKLVQKVIHLGFKFQSSHHAHSLHAPFWWLKCLIGLNHSNSDPKVVSLYHRVLVWDLMTKPFITGFIEKLLNPVMGKSLVLYFTKDIESTLLSYNPWLLKGSGDSK